MEAHLLSPHKAAVAPRASSVADACILRAHDSGRTCANCEYFKALTTKGRRMKCFCAFTGERLDGRSQR